MGLFKKIWTSIPVVSHFYAIKQEIRPLLALGKLRRISVLLYFVYGAIFAGLGVYYYMTPATLSETTVSVPDLTSSGWNCSLLATITSTVNFDVSPFGTYNSYGGITISSITVGGIAYDIDVYTPIQFTYTNTYMPSYAGCMTQVAAFSDLSSISTFSFSPAGNGGGPSDSMTPSAPVAGLKLGIASGFMVQSGQNQFGGSSNYAPLGTTDYLTPAMKAFFGQAAVKSAVTTAICAPFKTLASFQDCPAALNPCPTVSPFVACRLPSRAHESTSPTAAPSRSSLSPTPTRPWLSASLCPPWRRFSTRSRSRETQRRTRVTSRVRLMRPSGPRRP